jgi:hypothetical protein
MPRYLHCSDPRVVTAGARAWFAERGLTRRGAKVDRRGGGWFRRRYDWNPASSGSSSSSIVLRFRFSPTWRCGS